MAIKFVDASIGKKAQPVYVPITEMQKKTPLPKSDNEPEKIRSKVLIIENLSVSIAQNMDEDIDFKVNTIPGMLSDNRTVPELDITAKEQIDFDDELTRQKLESVIRRCGILEKYADYFTRDPDIVINSYTLTVKKNFRFFEEFKEAILTVGDIFTYNSD